MKISTNIGPIANIVGDEDAVKYIADAGFDAWDFSMFSMVKYDRNTQETGLTDHPLNGDGYIEYAQKLKEIGLKGGIVCNQSHAPFPVANKLIRSCLERSIESTGAAGGEICIIHPDNNKTAVENAVMYRELLPVAKRCNVKIATENMFNWKDDNASPAACSSPESFNAHLDALSDDYLVACLDIGHSQLKGLNTSPEEMITALGERIKALHIHDNDGIHDLHNIPFSGVIDFNKVVSALKAVNYSGYFTLEPDSHLKDCPKSEVGKRVKELADPAKRLADMFESL